MSMNHDLAVSTHAAERYMLGEMNVEERDRYEEHFFTCPECADAIKTAARFRDAAAELLSGQADGQASATAPNEDGSQKSRRAWISWGTLFWPLPAGAAASLLAALGFAGYQGLVVLPRMTVALDEAKAMQPAPGYFLTIARSAVPTVRVEPGQRVVVLTLSRSSDEEFPFYECVVRTADGLAVSRAVLPGPTRGAELQLLLPVEGLQPGSYSLAVAGLESPSAAESTRDPVVYPFTLERDGADDAE